jgi:peptide subunit release factor 1 (eRF1)
VEELAFIARKVERAHELEKADMLITASAKAQNAVTGISGTLDALNEKRVRELVYAEGYAAGTDFIEDAISVALAQGATIEQMRGEAAARLRAAGGIGAFLRY